MMRKSIMHYEHSNQRTKPSKYRNQKTVIYGITFDSKKEATRYQELLLLERAGEIRSIELQPRYDLVVNGKRICTYYADFRYKEVATRTIIVEDVKGFRTKEYIIKKKLVEAIYGVEIVEV